MNEPAVFLFESAAHLRESILRALGRHRADTSEATDIAGLLSSLYDRRPDVVILGPSVADPYTISETAREIRRAARLVPLILMASQSSEEFAIAALRAGINEYVKYPFSPEELLAIVERYRQQAVKGLSLSASGLTPAGGIVGNSRSMCEVRERLARAASSNSTVLITGETGTGKELAARLLHENSPRRHKPSVTINCAAIPDSLLESELFGYEKGAFTGAQSSREGKLKAAEGGTVFLDEIGDMSPYGQAKILRLIEERELQRLGRSGGIAIDVRFIAATNQDLEQLVKEEKFRKDLFFRLHVVRLNLPPLRERKEDLLSLINYYIAHFNRQFGADVGCVTDEALDYLLAYDWPGNVRELKNLLEGIFTEINSGDISLVNLPAQFCHRCAELAALSSNERVRLLWALTATNWNKSKAADKLKWSRMTLYRKIAQYNLSRI